LSYCLSRSRSSLLAKHLAASSPPPPLPRRYLEEAHDLQQHRTAFVADRAAFEPPAGLRVGGVGVGGGFGGAFGADDTGLGISGVSNSEFGTSSSSLNGVGFSFGSFSIGSASSAGGGVGGIAPSSLGGIAGPYRAGGSLIGGGASSNRL
jgi:hypothetical protein